MFSPFWDDNIGIIIAVNTVLTSKTLKIILTEKIDKKKSTHERIIHGLLYFSWGKKSGLMKNMGNFLHYCVTWNKSSCGVVPLQKVFDKMAWRGNRLQWIQSKGSNYGPEWLHTLSGSGWRLRSTSTYAE